jgi:hypothetical protein
MYASAKVKQSVFLSGTLPRPYFPCVGLALAHDHDCGTAILSMLNPAFLLA